jgi:hypothetical protein
MELDIADITKINESALKTFDESIAAADPDMCWEFDEAVARLESQLIQLYGIVVLALKREEDLSVIAKTWGGMVGICDHVARKIGALSQQHPNCAVSHDKILDLRNRCERIRNLHS